MLIEFGQKDSGLGCFGILAHDGLDSAHVDRESPNGLTLHEQGNEITDRSAFESLLDLVHDIGDHTGDGRESVGQPGDELLDLVVLIMCRQGQWLTDGPLSQPL
ncbi:hypothetical protein AB0H50_33470 [Nocardia sp. NPDC050793]